MRRIKELFSLVKNYLLFKNEPDNYFAEVEQVAFNPASVVPGIDHMLQARMFSYQNAVRYLL